MSKVYTRQRQTKTGCSWEWRFEAPKTDGKRRQFSKSGYLSESEALAAGYAELNRVTSGSADFGSSIPLNKLLSEYTNQILFPGLSKGTADNYRALVANHIAPAIGDVKLSEITSEQILEFYNGVRLKGVSQFPLASIKRILSGAFEYARIKGYLASDPMDGLKLPKSIKKTAEKSAYTPQQIQLMAESLPATNDRRLPFMIAVLTGMREAEIAGLTWDDVDLENQVIRVGEQLHCNGAEACYGLTKNHVVRYIPFRGSLAEILEKAKSSKDKMSSEARYVPIRLADGRVSYSADSGSGKMLDMVCSKADGRCLSAWDFKAISTIIKRQFDPEFSFHTLRHSHATIALDSGAEIKAVADRLGHKDIRTTLAVYAHVNSRLRAETAEIIESRFSGDELRLVHTA